MSQIGAAMGLQGRQWSVRGERGQIPARGAAVLKQRPKDKSFVAANPFAHLGQTSD